ncbi:MAG: hypothetical protein IH910_00195 [Proteobacteria bacterium]|nr:hypothetical protein [Pseudomonadota bacterium]
MTTIIVASAPGKVVLCGEYAVLDGAPAICMAINRRAVASLSPARGKTNRVVAPGYAKIEGEFLSHPDGIEWLQGKDEFEIVDAVWRVARGQTEEACTIVLDSREFIDESTSTKFGIGSSAALTVALTLAMSAGDNKKNLSRDASRAHAVLQGGAGSGVDIACSVKGGLIAYCMQGAKSSSLQWPESLAYRLLWTGVATSTATKLKVLKTGTPKPSRARLRRAAEIMAEAWRSGAADNVLAAYHDYIVVLRSFSVDHDLGVFDAGHGQVADAAIKAGLVYKPCGAGGGDVGILFGTDETRLDAFVNKEMATAYSLLRCEVDYSGARIEAT